MRAAESKETSSLAAKLLDHWAWGAMSAERVQELAQCAYEDGTSSAATAALAKIGSGAQKRHHAQRDLLVLLAKQLPRQVQPVIFQLPLCHFKHSRGTRHVAQPYLPLYRVWAHMYETYPAQFAKTWGTEMLAARFWGNLRPDDPNFAQWQRKFLGRDLGKLLVFAIHGDAVPVFKHKSLMCWSATALLGEGSAKEIKSLFSCYWSYMRAKTAAQSPEDDSEGALWQVGKWDLTALFLGIHPSTDWLERPWPANSVEAQLAGKPIAGGFAGVPWVIKGDMDFFAKDLGLESSASAHPCCWCPADREAQLWTDFRPDAPWKSQCFCFLSREDWEAQHPRRHPMFSILCIGHRSVHVDTMHTHALGVAQHVAGNALELLVFYLLPRNSKLNLDNVWEHVLQHFKEHRSPVQIRKLTTTMFHHPGGFPELTTKAKETEYLTSAVLSVWQELADLEDPVNQSVEAALKCTVAIFDEVRQVGSELHLPEEAQQRLARAVDGLLAHYTALGNEAQLRGVKLWSMRPKHHVLWHMAQQARYLHPRASQCYADESFVGSIKLIAQKCTSGERIEECGQIVMTKYLYGMQLLRLKNHGHGKLIWK